MLENLRTISLIKKRTLNLQPVHPAGRGGRAPDEGGRGRGRGFRLPEEDMLETGVGIPGDEVLGRGPGQGLLEEADLGRGRGRGRLMTEDEPEAKKARFDPYPEESPAGRNQPVSLQRSVRSLFFKNCLKNKNKNTSTLYKMDSNQT